VKAKRTADDDKGRLDLHVYPVIGNKPVASVTLEHCESVMARLPATLSPASRRHVGQLLARMLKLAVYPLRIIDQSPIPDGFVPKLGGTKAKGCLYPGEDRRLMACKAIPLAWRLLWGFLAREGMRSGEAITLAVQDLDLKRGAVRLDRNKTSDPRAWALSPGVARALSIYLSSHRKDAKPTHVVFTDDHGRPLQKDALVDIFRNHLATIGLKQERPELFTATAERLAIRVHDLRGTFVTVSLANDKTESWISDRTGHRSSQMIARYKRTARTFTELGLGDLTPLDAALPEIGAEPPKAGARRGSRASRRAPRVGHRVGQKLRAPSDSNGRPTDSKSVALSSSTSRIRAN